MRFSQRASVHQLMREYQIFAEILERFIGDEATKLGSRADLGQAMSALSRATQAVRVLQQQMVDTFVDCYTDTIERQTAQLRSFSRLVSHEIRQLLGVLQVLSRMLPVAGKAQAAGTLAGVVFNAGAYTHTSLALHDAIKGAAVHVIELHISNVHAREAFRHHSWLSPVAQGVMVGFGTQGYALAIAALALQPAASGRQ